MKAKWKETGKRKEMDSEMARENRSAKETRWEKVKGTDWNSGKGLRTEKGLGSARLKGLQKEMEKRKD